MKLNKMHFHHITPLLLSLGVHNSVFTGISMTLLQSKNGIHYFTFEHSRDYQQVQFKFMDAVKSMDPNNIVVTKSSSLICTLLSVIAMMMVWGVFCVFWQICKCVYRTDSCN